MTRAALSRLSIAVAAFGIMAAGCDGGSLTGRESAAALISPAEEARIGAEQHPEVTKEFGGAYPDPALGAYVAQIGLRLSRYTGQPNQHWTFTLLNSDMVNAFALPGGYVYVTRGLLALAENEAELAGVMAHEMGHVTARHSAERISRAQIYNLGLFGLGILGGGTAAQGGAVLAEAMLQSYSRDQEFEADNIGVRYMTAAGYDPNAMASFLRKLEAHAALEAHLAGQSQPTQTDIMSTHPRTEERVQRAVQAAGGTPPAAPGVRVGGHDYLMRIEGLYVDGDPQNGIVKERRFIHPELRFTFEVPPGYALVNGQEQVAAQGPGGSLILFTMARAQTDAAPLDYLTRVWAPRAPLSGVERLTVNGLSAATGTVRLDTNQGPRDARLIAIRGEPATYYRFLFVTAPDQTAGQSEALRRTTYSFRRLSQAEAAAAKPFRLRIVTVREGDTVERIAARMPYADLKLERFRVLNGMVRGEPIRPGQLVKIVSE